MTLSLLLCYGPLVPICFFRFFFLSLLPFPFSFSIHTPHSPNPLFQFLLTPLSQCPHFFKLNVLGFPSFSQSLHFPATQEEPSLGASLRSRINGKAPFCVEFHTFASTLQCLSCTIHYFTRQWVPHFLLSIQFHSFKFLKVCSFLQRLLVGFSQMPCLHSPNGCGHSKHPPKPV